MTRKAYLEPLQRYMIELFYEKIELLLTFNYFRKKALL